DGPQRPMVELWAIDFNVGSFDNCTPQEELLYTFNNWKPQVTDTIIAGRLINIDVPHYFDDKGAVMAYPTTNAQVLNRYNNGELQLWLPSLRSSARVWTDAVLTGDTNKVDVDVMMSVWDKKFNVDFCWVKLSIICNTCPDNGGGARVAGLVYTEQGAGVHNVEVQMYDAQTNMILSTVTDVNGAYTFNNVPASGRLLSSLKDTDHGNGVSTLDLVLIQRHILGIQYFDNPYNIIAGDVNNDRKINSVDLVELRKVILGTATRFTNTSWRFPDANAIMDVSNVFPFKESMDVSNIGSGMSDVNFMAVKIGDINGSASTDVLQPQGESRSSTKLNLTAEDRSVEAGEVVEVAVTSSDFNDVFGFQYTMNLNGANFVDVVPGTINVAEDNVGVITSDMITMSFAASEAVTTKADEVLFTIVLKANKAAQLSEMMQINSDVTRAESYTGSGMKVQNIGLTVGSKNTSAAIELFQNEPNPFKATTHVSFFMP